MSARVRDFQDAWLINHLIQEKGREGDDLRKRHRAIPFGIDDGAIVFHVHGSVKGG